MKIAFVLTGVIACSGVQVGTVAPPNQSPQSNCRPSDFANKKNSGFKIKTLREGSLRKKIALGPCISDEIARQILRGFQAGHVRNRLAARADGSQPELPRDIVSRLSSIAVGKPDEVPPGSPVPAFQYTVTMTDHGSSGNPLGGSGDTLYVNLRDDQIEVVGAAVWMS